MACQRSSSAATKESVPPPNPWEALFVSATRPQPALPILPFPDNADANADANSTDGGDQFRAPGYLPSTNSQYAAGGYTILIQHSLTPKAQRKWALASTMANTTEYVRSKATASKMISPASSTARRQRVQGNVFGISGPFLTRQSFQELCLRCNGSVVYVSVLGTSGVFDLDGVDAFPNKPVNNQSDDAHLENDANSPLQESEKWRASINMFLQSGICVDLSSNPFSWEDEEESYQIQNICFKSDAAIDDLASVAKTIRQAATMVEMRRLRSHLVQQQKSTVSSTKGVKEMQKPIPVIFETVTPLLAIHGAEKVSLMLKVLGKVISSSSFISIIHKDMFLDVASIPQHIRPPILSPIIVPTLYESLPPSDHRLLEDAADSMISLNVIGCQSDTVVSSTIASGVLDVVRRGGGGTGMGGKFIRESVPLRIAGNRGETFHWILYHGEDSGQSIYDEANSPRVEETGSKKKEDESSNNSVKVHGASSSAVRPRIYLEDNDPEFDDFDEEDPDDDLDL